MDGRPFLHAQVRAKATCWSCPHVRLAQKPLKQPITKYITYANNNTTDRKESNVSSVRSMSDTRQDASGTMGTKLVPSETQEVWSPLLKDSTAILRDPDSDATVYILGVSHVSKQSCNLIQELIEKVQPDAVMLELCSERTGLLINERSASNGENAWFSDSVDIIGLDQRFSKLYKSELLKKLRTYGGGPVSTQGIQQDADVLLATGLFESVTPITSPPRDSEWDPIFLYLQNAKKMIPGVQLGSIKFKVTPRRLPLIDHISEITLDAEISSDIDKEKIISIIEKGMEDAHDKKNTMEFLLFIKEALFEHTKGKYDLMYHFDSSTETPIQVLARVINSKGELFEHNTSFEETIKMDGSGIGITRKGNAPFLGFQKIGKQLNSSSHVSILPWDMKDKIHDSSIPLDKKINRESTGGVLESLANSLTMTYGKYQSDAGRKVGILPGEAWRVALEAAAKSNTRYIFLGDRLASVTGERLLKAIISSSWPSFLVGAMASAVSWLTPPLLLNMPSSLPISLLTTLLSITAASWPLLSPIQEIKAFSEMSAKEIEDAVRVNEPLQSTESDIPFYLWGEDALIRWPGAETPVIRERDEYMSYAIHAFLNNIDSGLTPAYVATSEESYGATVYSYAMPKGSSKLICPPGKGQGQFELGIEHGNPPPKIVVAVVGTAHVRGMIKYFKNGFVPNLADRLEKLSI